MAESKYLDGRGLSRAWTNIKAWVNTQLAGKSNTGHTHSYSSITNLSTWKTNNFGRGTYSNAGSLTIPEGTNIKLTAETGTSVYPQADVRFNTSQFVVTSGRILFSPRRYIYFVQNSTVNISSFGLGSMWVIFCLVNDSGQVKINIEGASQNVDYTAVASVNKRGEITVSSSGSGSTTISGFNRDDIVMVMLFG